MRAVPKGIVGEADTALDAAIPTFPSGDTAAG